MASEVASSIAWVLAAIPLSIAVGRAFTDGAGRHEIAAPLAAVLGLVVGRVALAWTADACLAAAGRASVRRARDETVRALVARGPAVAQDRRAGAIVRTASAGADTFADYVTRYRPARAAAVAVPLAVALLVAALDPASVLILVLTGPMLVLLLSLIGARVRDATRRREAELSWMSAHFLDLVRGLPTLELFGRSREQAHLLREVGRRYSDTAMDVLRTAFQTSLVLEWGAAAATALVAIELSVRLMGGEVPFQRAFAVLLVTPEFFAPLRRLSLEYHVRTAADAAATDIDQLVASVPAATPGGRPVPSALDVRFEDVVVERDGRRALDGLTLTIPAGWRVAVVGDTGAGKSTLVALLLRALDPSAGTITVGDEPLRSVDVDAWRRTIAWVPQRPHLFAGTVAENVRLGSPGASDEDVVDAVRAAAADAFVGRLPGGYETSVGEGGATLSGGERQRIAIARALVRNAPILLLDEPTSHLDARTERAVLDAIRDRTHGRTVITVSHQSDPIADADLVITLDAGRRSAGAMP